MTAWHEGPPGTVGGLLARRAAQDPHSPFVKCGGDWLSAQTMMDSASAVAAGLTALGLSKGDRIATLLPNRQEALELFFTCAQLGLILVPLNAFLKRIKRETPAAPTTKVCPECLSEIPLQARRCAHCSSVVEVAPPNIAQAG